MIFLSNPVEFLCQPSLPASVSLSFIPTKLASLYMCLNSRFTCERLNDIRLFIELCLGLPLRLVGLYSECFQPLESEG